MLAFIMAAVCLSELFAFFRVLRLLVSDFSLLTPYSLFIAFGPLAFGLSAAYGALLQLRLVPQMTRFTLFLAWAGVSWGLFAHTERIYPWNIGLVLAFGLIGVLLSRKLPKAPRNGATIPVSEPIESRSLLLRYLWVAFVVSLIGYIIFSGFVRISERSFEQLTASSVAIRVALWSGSCLAMGTFCVWQLLKRWKMRDRLDSSDSIKSAMSPIFAFVIAEYVAANGLVLGLLLKEFVEQYALSLIALLFFFVSTKYELKSAAQSID